MSSANRRVRKQKNLVYKDKKYPIYFDLLSHYSDFFYNNEDDYKDLDDIVLTEEPIEITDESLNIFVRFCQSEHVEGDINDSNVFGIKQLADHYEVIDLKNIISRYISDNPNLSLQSILVKLSSNKEIDSNDEKIISSHFFNFIDNEQMLKIPVPVLYRIINHYEFKINELNESDSNKLLNFLLKYLKENGKEASILFSTIDIQRSRIDLIQTLLSDEYSDKFDFYMLNPKMGINTIRELLNEITKMKLEFSTKIDEMNKTIEKQKDNYSKLSSQIAGLTQLVNDQIYIQNSKIHLLDNNIPQINLDDFEIKEVIGKGGFSVISRGIIKLTGQEVAIKSYYYDEKSIIVQCKTPLPNVKPPYHLFHLFFLPILIDLLFLYSNYT